MNGFYKHICSQNDALNTHAHSWPFYTSQSGKNGHFAFNWSDQSLPGKSHFSISLPPQLRGYEITALCRIE